MFRYDYYRARSLSDAVRVLDEFGDKARIVAGGTDLLVQIYEKDKRWKNLQCLLDITYLDRELNYITEDETSVYIGPLATHRELEESDIICRCLPYLGAAAASVGSPQIRNKGTIGGSIGNAFPASDPLPTLIASDAMIKVCGPQGERTFLLKDFYEGKGSLKLQRGEFIREFIINKFPEGTKTGFSKLGRRKALAIARLNCAAALTIDDCGMIKGARIAPGCIFILPDRVSLAEELLLGKQPSKELFEEAGKIVSDVMIERTGVRWSTEYKQPVVQEFVYRALCQAAGMEVQP